MQHNTHTTSRAAARAPQEGVCVLVFTYSRTQQSIDQKSRNPKSPTQDTTTPYPPPSHHGKRVSLPAASCVRLALSPSRQQYQTAERNTQHRLANQYVYVYHAEGENGPGPSETPSPHPDRERALHVSPHASKQHRGTYSGATSELAHPQCGSITHHHHPAPTTEEPALATKQPPQIHIPKTWLARPVRRAMCMYV